MIKWMKPRSGKPLYCIIEETLASNQGMHVFPVVVHPAIRCSLRFELVGSLCVKGALFANAMRDIYGDKYMALDIVEHSDKPV